ncbi:MAG TPA: biopolymer transporter ExbD [Victivallales bacterium]|nr:biopolymer transporter ExbD [Victivallales bacterium]
MSVYKTKLSIIKGRPDLTPMIDVVFLLLLFFMISSSFVQISGIEIKLPEAVEHEETRAEKVVITVENTGTYLFNDQRFDWKNLKEQLGLYTAKWKVDSVIIMADKSTEYGEIVKLMSLARSLKLNVYAATSPEKRVDSNDE